MLAYFKFAYNTAAWC